MCRTICLDSGQMNNANGSDDAVECDAIFNDHPRSPIYDARNTKFMAIAKPGNSTFSTKDKRFVFSSNQLSLWRMNTWCSTFHFGGTGKENKTEWMKSPFVNRFYFSEIGWIRRLLQCLLFNELNSHNVNGDKNPRIKFNSPFFSVDSEKYAEQWPVQVTSSSSIELYTYLRIFVPNSAVELTAINLSIWDIFSRFTLKKSFLSH